jgi:ADP-heptose:LPS heptosyltransferase
LRIALFVENRPFFGAVLVHAPLLWELRLHHPGASITLFTPFRQAELLVRLELADEIHFYERDRWATGRRLRSGRFDAVFNLRPASRWLDLVVGASGVADRRGFRSALGRIAYTRRVPHDTSIYRPRKYLSLLDDSFARRDLGGFFRSIAGGSGECSGRTLLYLPGGGDDFKRWRIERFLDLAAAVSRMRPDLEPIFILGPAEAGLREPIEAWRASHGIRVDVVLDASVATLAALALDAVAAVGNDCGPGHIVQMCGRPFVCVMSDRDGSGRGRRHEWIDAANQSLVVMSRPGEPIGSVPVEAVVPAIERALLAGSPAAVPTP